MFKVLYFDKLNIINFQKRFANLCNKYRISILYKIVRLLRYCNKFIENFLNLALFNKLLSNIS